MIGETVRFLFEAAWLILPLGSSKQEPALLHCYLPILLECYVLGPLQLENDFELGDLLMKFVDYSMKASTSSRLDR